jgi:hypothetical protein
VASRTDPRDRLVGVPNVVGDRVVASGVGAIDQPVRHALALVARRLRRRGVEAAVDLKGVAPHDFSAEKLGDPHGEPRLARPRRTAQDEDRRLGGRS